MSPHDAVSLPECTTCHASTEVWGEVHPTEHTLSLDGGHSQAACFDCHQDVGHEDLSQGCYACHEAPHTSPLTAACGECHEVKTGWGEVTYENHPAALTGGHLAAGCFDCHERPGFVDLDPSCENCHASSHGAGASGQCQECHQPGNAWATVTYDDHPVELVDRHGQAACFECHERPSFGGLEYSCAACHEKPHEVGGDYCIVCHQPAADWSFVMTAEHAFPMDHQGMKVNCGVCHPDGDITTYSCSLCHSETTVAEKHEALGLKTVPEDCMACHSGG
jgi:hypothetical protein